MSSTNRDLFAVVDCNNFFVSCERVFQPHLKYRPTIVLSNNDGCAIARSNDVKALGIPMGAPLYQFKELVLRHNIALLSSNFTLYADMSRRVMQTIEEFFDMAPYSIDEAFIHLPEKNALAHARHLHQTLYQRTGIPVSIGIGKTKTAAKVAVEIAKNQSGVHLLTPKDLKTFPLKNVWGIGKASRAKLPVTTAADFCALPESYIRKTLKKPGLCTWMELRDVPCYTLEQNEEIRKSLLVSRSFSPAKTTQEELMASLAAFIDTACTKLRKEQIRAHYFSLFIQTNRFETSYYSGHREITFPSPTSDTPKLLSLARTMLSAIFREGLSYKKAGILLADFTTSTQLSLFEEKTTDDKTLQIYDRINRRFGKQTITFASQISPHNTPPPLNRSPPYTTSWPHLLTISI